MQYESTVIQLLQQALGLSENEISELLDIPPNTNLGDIAFPCFKLSKKLNKSPQLIAKDLEMTIKIPDDSIVREIKAMGAFLNFFFDSSKLAEKTLKKIWNERNQYGFKPDKQKTVLIEFPSPNTNKQLHLGHLRNMALGESTSRIIESQGYSVIRANLLNDRGVHICKSMLAYKKWGKNRNPDKKTDHFVGEFYVLFSKKATENPKLEEEAQELLKLWEAKDPETIALWEKMTDWATNGFIETFTRFGISFNKTYRESDLWEKGKDIILHGLEANLFYKDKVGNIVVDLGEPLGTKVLLRANGTSVYVTQDIYLAKKKHEDFNYFKSIYVIGSEQNYHLSVLFKILKILKYEFADGCYHLSHGMIFLPEGKMKSREGTVVDADEIIDELTKMAKSEILSRKKISDSEIDNTAEKIAMAALKYFLLKFVASKDFVFNPKESVSLYGKTGPYLQYSFVRANRILQKIKKKPSLDVNFSLLDKPEEIALIRLLKDYPDSLEQASQSYSPHVMAEYAHELASSFNLFYEKYQVIGESEEEIQNSRLLLVECFREVMRNCLYMFGIDTVDIM
ncbi:MAG: arginine--tRNA ligase [Candidatus Heimdallarchaeota archaeon]|nr:MAG: arginine--tRNA ligase [Candidatus Heimdallarchaeota archaeon]